MALTPAALRLDGKGRACGQSHISSSKTCHHKGAFPTGKAIAAGLTAGAVGAALLHKGSRKAILSAPSAAKRTAQRAITEVVHSATAPEPSMRLTPRAFNQAKRELKRSGVTGGMRRHNLALEQLRRRIEPGYRTPRFPERSDVEFLNEKLHAAVKAEAKRKFKVYPSAYANAWMVQEYKSRGGKFRTDSLDKWFNEKWVRMSSTGKILGPCGDRTEGEGKPKCLPAAKAQALSPAERRTLVARKRRNDPNKERSGAPIMVSSKTDIWATGFDAEDGKKYVKTVTNPETGRKNKVRYGAKGYRIAPGTDKGDRYCARSFGDMKSEGYNCSGAERNTPLCLSRAKWKCSGKTSRRDEGLTPGKS